MLFRINFCIMCYAHMRNVSGQRFEFRTSTHISRQLSTVSEQCILSVVEKVVVNHFTLLKEQQHRYVLCHLIFKNTVCRVIMFLYWTCSVQHIYSNTLSVRVNGEHNMFNKKLSMKIITV
jgi:hypothetical protein